MTLIFSERELTFTVAISGRELAFTIATCHRDSVCLLSVTLVHPTQAVELFGIFFTIR